MFEIKLRIKDAFKEDLGKGIARCDPSLFSKYNLDSGDVIHIINPSSKNDTASYIHPSDPKDKDSQVIRLDAQSRRNLGAMIDDTVIINKTKTQSAQQISFAGYHKGISLKKPNLLMEKLKGHLVTIGDIFIFRSSKEKIELIVINHTPTTEVVRIGKNTRFFCQQQPYN
ncbi:MAG: hypothetical protein ACFFFT_01935 [Candidatus Thorarchaeota archaeon]